MDSKVKNGKVFGRQAAALKQGLKWSAMGISTLTAICLSGLPAVAAELSAWRYDSESRSLTLTLPESVTPNISVIAPDQLLVELPDTQIGDVHGQHVNDGFVEHIALEQATPETVWMVVDFVPGTVLSETQQATPLAASADTLQIWEVQPALTMASRRAVEAAVATQTDSGAGAAALAIETQSVGTAIAQSDFPDLPVLEPAAPLAQPVSVPPIDAAPVELPEVAASAVKTPVAIPIQPEESLPVVEADTVESIPSVVAVPTLPMEPPFLGEIDAVETIPTQPPEPIAVEPNPPANTALVDEEIVSPRVEGGSETDVVRIDSSSGRESLANTSRWPEPIPFGQPLP